jgi:hypothetical protein
VHARGRSRRPETLWCAVVLAIFALGTWWVAHPLGLASSSQLPTCDCGDQALQVWFLAADHYAVVHGHFSFLSTRLDYPSGVNLMDNTSSLLLGVLVTPLYWFTNAVGVYDFLLRAGVFLSAASCFFVLRRYVTSIFAAAIGGALYGFGPFISHQASDHFFLAFAPIPPILFLLVQSRLFDGRRRIGLGVAIGLLSVAQYFIASEVLVAAALLLVITVAILGAAELVWRRAVWDRVVASVPAIAVAAVIGVVVLAYPAWYAVNGPQHILGRTQQVVQGIRLINVFLPGTTDLFAGRWPGSMAFVFAQQGDLAYLGIPLLVIVAGIIILERRQRVVQFATVFGLASWVLSLGPRLQYHDRITRVRLPFDALERLPLFQDLVPSRFMLFADLAAAVILAVGVDGIIRRGRAWAGDNPGRLWHRRSATLAGVVVGVVGLLFVIPVATTPVVSTGVAKYFADGQTDEHIPVNGVALAYPYPMAPEAEAMVWAAADHLRFSLLGGYALRPFGQPALDKEPAMLKPTAVQDLLLSSWPAHLEGSRRVTVRKAELALPAFVRRYHVTTLLVDVAGRSPQRVERAFTTVYGKPYRYGNLLVWDIRHVVPHRPPARGRS